MIHQITTNIQFDNTEWTQDIYSYADDGFLINTIRGGDSKKQVTSNNSKRVYRSERHNLETIQDVLTSNVTTVDFHADRWPDKLNIERDVKTPRIKENYISTQLLEFDDDSKTPTTMEFWYNDTAFQKYGAFVVESSSSTPEAQKCHQILILDQPITDYNLTQEIMKGWYWYYGSEHADFKINSPMRLFFHKENANLICLKNVVSLTDIQNWFLDDYREFVNQGGENSFDQPPKKTPPPKIGSVEYVQLLESEKLKEDELYIASNNYTFPPVMKVDWKDVHSISEQIYRIDNRTTDELRSLKIGNHDGLYFKYQFSSRSEIVFNLIRWFIRNGYSESEIYDIFIEHNTILKIPFDNYFLAEYKRAWINIISDNTYIQLETFRKHLMTNHYLFNIKHLQILLSIISMGLRHNTLQSRITLMDITRMTGIVKYDTLMNNIKHLIDNELLNVSVELEGLDSVDMYDIPEDDNTHRPRKYEVLQKCLYTTNCEYTSTLVTFQNIEQTLHEIQALGGDYHVVNLLRDNDLSSKQLGDAIGISHNGMNQKLKKMLDGKIVKFYKKGRVRMYQLTDVAEDLIVDKIISQMRHTDNVVYSRMIRYNNWVYNLHHMGENKISKVKTNNYKNEEDTIWVTN